MKKREKQIRRAMSIECRVFRTTILAMVSSGDHKIVVVQGKWGKIAIKYDGKQLTDNPKSDFRFSVIEDGENVKYRVWFVGMGWRNVNIARNGTLIFGTEEGLVPPEEYDVEPQVESDSPQKEVVVREREVILVVCPHCLHRNDVSRRTCEMCGASI